MDLVNLKAKTIVPSKNMLIKFKKLGALHGF